MGKMHRVAQKGFAQAAAFRGEVIALTGFVHISQCSIGLAHIDNLGGENLAFFDLLTINIDIFKQQVKSVSLT